MATSSTLFPKIEPFNKDLSTNDINSDSKSKAA